jgi:preprotein translocase subunit SecE
MSIIFFTYRQISVKIFDESQNTLRFYFMATTPVVFLKEVNEELKKVVWPTRPEVIRLTTVVILVSLIVGIYLGALDLIFTKLLSLFIK